MAPEYMNDMFLFKVSPYYSLRNQNDLCLPKHRTNYCNRSFAYTELLVNNNDLPYDLRQISSFTAFKSKLNNR